MLGNFDDFFYFVQFLEGFLAFSSHFFLMILKTHVSVTFIGGVYMTPPGTSKLELYPVFGGFHGFM